MNTLKHNNTLLPTSGSSPAACAAPGPAEETLRLIATLPAPEGLAERVQAGLRAASLATPNPHRAKILRWPAALRLHQAGLHSAWVRGAAAAAIVFVVAGGGWGIYSRVAPTQQMPRNRGIALPHVATPGGFGGAGAMRTPQTLNGPAVVHPVTTQPATPAPQATNPGAKVAAKSNKTQVHRDKSVTTNKAIAPPVAPSAK